MNHRINTVSIDLLSDSSEIYVKSRWHYSQGPLFEWHKKGMQIKNDLYLQCLGHNDRYQMGYQWNCDTTCDLLKDLDWLCKRTSNKEHLLKNNMKKKIYASMYFYLTNTRNNILINQRIVLFYRTTYIIPTDDAGQSNTLTAYKNCYATWWVFKQLMRIVWSFVNQHTALSYWIETPFLLHSRLSSIALTNMASFNQKTNMTSFNESLMIKIHNKFSNIQVITEVTSRGWSR